jgi:Phage tail tube protein
MAHRIAGIAFWMVDGVQLAVRGNLEVMPSRQERTGIAGQDSIHGYSELPVVPYISGDVSTIEGTSVEDVDGITNATITAELANGTVYVLRNAWRAERSTINTRDGQFNVKFEGMSCDELVANV